MEWVLAFRHGLLCTPGFWIENWRGKRTGDEGNSKGNCYFIAENKEKQKRIASASTHAGQTAPCHLTVPGVGASRMSGVKGTLYQLSSFVLQSVCHTDGERIVLMKGKQLGKEEF